MPQKCNLFLLTFHFFCERKAASAINLQTGSTTRRRRLLGRNVSIGFAVIQMKRAGADSTFRWLTMYIASDPTDGQGAGLRFDREVASGLVSGCPDRQSGRDRVSICVVIGDAESREQILDATGEFIDKMYRVMAGSDCTTIRLGGMDEQDARQSHLGSGAGPDLDMCRKSWKSSRTTTAPSRPLCCRCRNMCCHRFCRRCFVTPSKSSSRRCSSVRIPWSSIPVSSSPSVLPPHCVYPVYVATGATFAS
jgi:hypothetical protein